MRPCDLRGDVESESKPLQAGPDFAACERRKEALHDGWRDRLAPVDRSELEETVHNVRFGHDGQGRIAVRDRVTEQI